MSEQEWASKQEALERHLQMVDPTDEGVPTVETMKRASAIDDDTLLQELIDLGIRPRTLTLMSVAPLVMVAWADGEVQEGERKAIMRVADGKGIVEGTPAFQMLERWLEAPPKEDLFEAWEAFVAAIIKPWPDDKADAYKQQLGGLARDVAGASGGMLGLGAVSAEEKQIIFRIEGAFDTQYR